MVIECFRFTGFSGRPGGSKNVTDVVQSLDRNLQHVAGETAVEIDKFLASRAERLGL